MLTPEMIAELNSLKDADGNIRTENVVALARQPSSALHKHPAFEWDLTKAAYRQWMDAARSVIQVWVGVTRDPGSGVERQMRVMVSRPQKDRIYEETVQVLLEDRAAIIGMVCDRCVSAIRSYPLVEFDVVLAMIEEIRLNATAKQMRKRKRKGGREVRLSA